MTLRSIRTGLLTIMSGDSQLHQSQALVIIYHLFCLLSPSSHALATSLPRASLFSTCLLFKIHLSLNSFQYTFFFLCLCSSDATHLLLLLSSHLFLTSWCLLCCRPSPALLHPPTHTSPPIAPFLKWFQLLFPFPRLCHSLCSVCSIMFPHLVLPLRLPPPVPPTLDFAGGASTFIQ